MIQRKMKKVLAFLLALALLLPATVVSAADGDTVSGGGVELTVGRAYAIPLNLSAGTLRIQSPPAVLANSSLNRFHLNDNALVRVKNASTVEVKLQLYSYDAIDAFQIIKPERIQDAIAQYDDPSNDQNAKFHNELKMANFTHTGAVLQSGISAGFADASGAFNDWWLPSSEIRVTRSEADRKLQNAYIAFDMPLESLQQPLLMKSYTSSINLQNSIIGIFDVSNNKLLPGKIPAGNYTFSNYWTNMARGSGANNGAPHERNVTATKNAVYSVLADSSTITANVAEDGKITAVATVNLNAKSYNVAATTAAISIPIERDIFGGTSSNGILSGYYNITTSASALDLTQISEDGATAKISFEIGGSYEDFAFGKPFAFTHVMQSNGGFTSHFAFLHLVPSGTFDDVANVPVYPDEQIGTETGGSDSGELPEGALTSNGLTLVPASETAFPENAVFTATPATSADGLPRMYKDNPQLFVNELNQVLDDSHYKAYSVELKDSDGNEIEQSGAYMEFALPDGWDINKLQVLSTSGTSPTEASLSRDFDKLTVKFYIRNGGSTSKINADFLFLDRAAFLNPHTEITQDGLYKTRAMALNAETNYLSMANYAFWGDIYIERRNGAYRLYVGVTPTYMEGYDKPDYLANMHLYPGNRNVTMPVAAEPFAYYADASTGALLKRFGDILLKCGAFDLGAPTAQNYYWTQFDVPTMGSSRDARLGFISFEKVDYPNPLAVYDKSLLLARIENVEKLLAGGTLAEGARTQLEAAVSTARNVYAASPSSDGVKAAVDALAAAVAQAEQYDPSLIDKSALLVLIAQAKDIPSSGYTELSFVALRSAIASAEAAAADNTATRPIIEARTEALRAALENLVEITEKTEGITNGTYSL
ncbi:MAG: hypothetical protein LBL66_02570, partial [Clostridiales bacterium]|nr:hypothetical protein [Clostridiales bacterium]